MKKYVCLALALTSVCGTSIFAASNGCIVDNNVNSVNLDNSIYEMLDNTSAFVPEGRNRRETVVYMGNNNDNTSTLNLSTVSIYSTNSLTSSSSSDKNTSALKESGLYVNASGILRNSVAEIQEESKQKKQKAKTLTHENLETYERYIKVYVDRIKKYKEQLRINEEIANLEKQLDEKRKELGLLNAELAKKTTEEEDKTKLYIALEDKLNSLIPLSSQLELLKIEQKRLVDDYSRLTIAFSEGDCKWDIDKVNQCTAEWNENIIANNIKIAQLRKEISNSDIEKIKRALKKLKPEVLKCNAEVVSNKEKINKLSNDIKEMEQKLAGLPKTKESMNSIADYISGQKNVLLNNLSKYIINAYKTKTNLYYDEYVTIEEIMIDMDSMVTKSINAEIGEDKSLSDLSIENVYKRVQEKIVTDQKIKYMYDCNRLSLKGKIAEFNNGVYPNNKEEAQKRANALKKHLDEIHSSSASRSNSANLNKSALSGLSDSRSKSLNKSMHGETKQKGVTGLGGSLFKGNK